MFACKKITLVLLGCLMLSAAPLQAAPPAAGISARLANVLDRNESQPATADQPVAVWVRFRDRGLTPTEAAVALDRVRRELAPAALERRERVIAGKEAGERSGAIDESDLPVHAAYLASVQGTGARPRQTSRWLNAGSWLATPAQIAAIAELDCVLSVDLVASFQQPRIVPTAAERELVDRVRAEHAADKSARWSRNYGGTIEQAEMINLPPVHERGLSGTGVVIGVIDTGFEFVHEAMQDVDIVATWDFIHGQEDVSDTFRDPVDQSRHGSRALSLIAGYREGGMVGTAWNASFILAKTEDIADETHIEEDNWIAALEWMEGLGVDIVSSAVGYYLWYDYSDMDGNTAPITLAADMAAARGVCMVISAGDQNGEPGLPPMVAPADGRNVITVGSVMINGQVTSGSSRGPTYDGRIKPDVMAMGFGAVAAGYYGDWVYTPGWSTSFANAQVAGVVALMLEQNPDLTPLQVREALRRTASRTNWPDNDYGWGIVDASAAVAYWGPTITHTPLPDSDGSASALTVQANITSRLGLYEDSITLSWRVNFGSWQRRTMVRTAGDVFAAEMTDLPNNAFIEYYLEAIDQLGYVVQEPRHADPMHHTFLIRPDVESPVLAHTPLADQRLAEWPPRLMASATDNQGVDRVEVFWNVNGGSEAGPLPLQRQGDEYTLDFPLPAGQLQVGDTVGYRLVAADHAAPANTASDGDLNFRIVENRGRVLLLDDLTPSKSVAELPVNPHGTTTPPDPGKALSVDAIEAWLADAGYEVVVRPAGLVREGDLAGFAAVVLSSGGNYFPISVTDLRLALLGYVRGGGRLLVEGGEIAYTALQSPGYPEFAAEVLHITPDFAAEGGYQLHKSLGQDDHIFARRPNILPHTVDLGLPQGAIDYGTSDVIRPLPDAKLVYSTPYGDLTGGILLYDDNTGPDAGQIVFLPFKITALKPALGRQVLENAISYLTQRERPGRSAISGRVLLSDEADPLGITVQTDSLHTTTTAADGTFLLSGLWGGTVRLTISREGYATKILTLDLVDDQTVAVADQTLGRVIERNYTTAPAASIPDNNAAGISSSILVAEAGTVQGLRVSVDISHYSVNNLTVDLIGPSGTTVRLHDRSGGTLDDIVGTWPGQLAVDGPGALSDFDGESVSGEWTLLVADHQFGAIGTVNTWGLELLISPPTSGVPDRGGRNLTYLSNYPNPFNPRTVISFELKNPGNALLEIYDVGGRLVRRLHRGPLAAGRHEVVWDGLSAGGYPPSSGVYFTRLVGDDETLVRRMTLIR